LYSFTVKNFVAMVSLNLMLFASGAAGVWLDVPFVKQDKNACGAASIAMVMQYWKHQQREPADVPDSNEIQRSIYSDQAHGIFASEMEHYLKQHGYRAFAFRGRMDDIKDHLEKGRPLIVALKPSAGGAMLHYVVVVGLDPDAGLVLKNDPAERKLLKQTQSDFEREWKGAGNWTLLAVPLENGPASSRPSSSQ
jgi:ABC-type bacteriocin/lantibiotic exporter with double-glycine peptidase domain